MEANAQNNVSENTSKIQTTNKNNSFLISLLSSLLLIACIIAGFFAYQTQKLVKEITNLKLAATPSPTSSSSTELPNDWATYTDKVYGYSVKYPRSWKVRPTPSDGFGGVAGFEGLDTNLEIGKHTEKIRSGESLKDYFLRTQEVINIQDEKEMTLGEREVLRLMLPIIHGDSTYQFGIYYTFKRNDEVYFAEFYTNNIRETKIPDLIVSTITFNQDEIGCPEDARICPDGSSVVRTGPNCEFAPCPTTKP